MWLFGCWLLFWSGATLNTVNTVPYLMAITHESERSYAFSSQAAIIAGMAFAGSVAAGFLPDTLAGWLGSTLDHPALYRYVLWLAPCVYLLSMFAYVAAEPVKQKKQSVDASNLKPPLGLFLMLGLVAFAQAAAGGGVRAFFNVYLDRELFVSTALIGGILGAGQLVPLYVALMTPAILGRWGPARTLALVSVLMGLVMIPLAAIPIWQAAAVSFMGVLCLIAIKSPARKIFSQEIVEPRWRSTTSAVNTIGVALGWAATSALGGYLMPVTGFGGLVVLGCTLTMGASLVLLGYLRGTGLRPAAGGATE